MKKPQKTYLINCGTTDALKVKKKKTVKHIQCKWVICTFEKEYSLNFVTISIYKTTFSFHRIFRSKEFVSCITLKSSFSVILKTLSLSEFHYFITLLCPSPLPFSTVFFRSQKFNSMYWFSSSHCYS